MASRSTLRALFAWISPGIIGALAVYQLVLLIGADRFDWSTTLLSALIFLNIAGLSCLIATIRSRIRILAFAALGMIVVVGFSFGVNWLNRSWDRDFSGHYQRRTNTSVFEILEHGESEIPAVLCVLDYRLFPFFGVRRQYRVCQPERIPSYLWLLDYLRTEKAGFLVVRSQVPEVPAGWDAYAHPEAWMPARTDELELIHEDGTYKLYRVRLDTAGTKHERVLRREASLSTGSITQGP